MGLFRDIVAPVVGATYHDAHDFWYSKDPFGWAADASTMPVSPEHALRLGTVNACVGLISDMLGTMPLILYKRLSETNRQRASTNPLYARLRRQPNARQTAKEWLTMGGAHLLLRGNFYNEIVLDGRAAIAELRPLHPDRTRVVDIAATGRRGYVYRGLDGVERRFTQDEVFHVMGLTLDGVTGVSVFEYARQTIAGAIATEHSANLFWQRGAQQNVVFSTPATMSDETRKANETALLQRMGGLANAHKVVMLEGDLKPVSIGVSARDSQYIEGRRFSVAELCRFFRVPPVLVGDSDGGTTWGTGIESLINGFVKFTLMPWMVSIEQAVGRDLIIDDSFYAEFLPEALLRGDIETRAKAYQIATGSRAWMSPNEVRVAENMNERSGLDEVEMGVQGGTLGGSNQNPQRQPSPQRPTPARRPAPEPDEEAADRTWRMAAYNAERLIAREVKHVGKWAPRLAGHEETWRKWVAEFYGTTYLEELEAALALEPDVARHYCAGRVDAVVASRGVFPTDYERSAAMVLTALATGDFVVLEERHEHRAPALAGRNGRHA